MTRPPNTILSCALRGALCAAAVALVLAVSPAAHAHGAGRAPEPKLQELPDGPLKNRLNDVKERAKKGGHSEALYAQPFREALRAAERSRGARVAGDGQHAGQLVALAKRWIRVAATLVRAADAERAAAEAEKKAEALSSKLERAELLLAEQQSRLGRVMAALKAARERADARRQSNATKEKQRVLGKDQKRAKGRRP